MTMVQISRVLRQKPEGPPEFPTYRVNSIAGGKIFAEASMGFLGRVEYGRQPGRITVRTTTDDPIAATLGCQLAGWTLGSSMISGSVRFIAKKPSFVFDKIHFDEHKMQPVACVEGDATPASIIAELQKRGISSAEILMTEENSPTQYVNIPARAIEIALFRLFMMTSMNKIRVSKAVSTVSAPLSTGDMSSILNDAIRNEGRVTLIGDFGGFKDFETLVTRNTHFSKKTFEEVMKEAGSVAKCPVELFSVAHLTVVDAGKTRVF